MLYVIHGDDKDEVIRLTYRTEPGFVVSDQPSLPREERTAYRFNETGDLVLVYEGEESTYQLVGDNREA